MRNTFALMYKIKEVYRTLQGEGYHTGREAVFVRFSGCNLWSGREEDRHKAICRFCDTEFVGTDGTHGGHYTAAQLCTLIIELWDQPKEPPYVVMTGGEPTLQVDAALIRTMKSHNIITAIETNGTRPCPDGLDWICMSPKARTDIVQTSGDELKLVHPQVDLDPAEFVDMDFEHFYLQPMDGDSLISSLNACKAYITQHDRWKISIQYHKIWGIA